LECNIQLAWTSTAPTLWPHKRLLIMAPAVYRMDSIWIKWLMFH